MSYSFDWYALSREAVPGVLLGAEDAGEPFERGTPFPAHRPADLVVGFDRTPGTRADPTPDIALVDESRAPELFAWLQTYSAESFPVSRYCRVETAPDWRAMVEADRAGPPTSTPAWASVVAAEMLANGETAALDPKAMPLSWAAGCFSFAMARSARVAWRTDAEWHRRTAGRLHVLESDARFVRHRLGVDLLSPIWTLLASGALPEGRLADVVEISLSALSEPLAVLLRAGGELASSSAEERIHGFDAAVAGILEHARANPGERFIGATLAAAALLAGDGTSHIDLLRPYKTQVPDCLPWFGLLAGLSGPAAWDPDWLRLVKGVERQIRGRFEPTDPLAGDLCWIEFDWLRSVGRAPGLFSQLPRHHMRSLAVEIAPGATCQMRLGTPPVESETTHPSASPKSRHTTGPIANAPAGGEEVQTSVPAAFIAELGRLSAQLTDLLQSIAPRPATVQRQTALFVDVPGAKRPKMPGARKSRTRT